MKLTNGQLDVYPMFPSDKFIGYGDIVIMQLVSSTPAISMAAVFTLGLRLTWHCARDGSVCR
jgi:hypothetical protein